MKGRRPVLAWLSFSPQILRYAESVVMSRHEVRSQAFHSSNTCSRASSTGETTEQHSSRHKYTFLEVVKGRPYMYIKDERSQCISS